MGFDPWSTKIQILIRRRAAPRSMEDNRVMETRGTTSKPTDASQVWMRPSG